MKPIPRVRLIQSWQTYSKGAFLWPSTTTRNWLLATGRAVIDLEVAPVPSEVDPVPTVPASRRHARVTTAKESSVRTH